MTENTKLRSGQPADAVNLCLVQLQVPLCNPLLNPNAPAPQLPPNESAMHYPTHLMRLQAPLCNLLRNALHRHHDVLLPAVAQRHGQLHAAVCSGQALRPGGVGRGVGTQSVSRCGGR